MKNVGENMLFYGFKIRPLLPFLKFLFYSTHDERHFYVSLPVGSIAILVTCIIIQENVHCTVIVLMNKVMKICLILIYDNSKLPIIINGESFDFLAIRSA